MWRMWLAGASTRMWNTASSSGASAPANSSSKTPGVAWKANLFPSHTPLMCRCGMEKYRWRNYYNRPSREMTAYFFPSIGAQKPAGLANSVTDPRHFGQTVDNLPATCCESSFDSGQTAPQFGLLQRYCPPLPGFPRVATDGPTSATGAGASGGASARRRGKVRAPGFTGCTAPPDCWAADCGAWALASDGIVTMAWQPGQLICSPAPDSSILMRCLQCGHSKRISIIPNYIVRVRLAK